MRQLSPNLYYILFSFLFFFKIASAQNAPLSPEIQQILKDSLDFYQQKAGQAMDNQEALSSYEKVLEFNQQMLLGQEDSSTARIMWSIGEIYLDDRVLDKAALNFNQALAIYQTYSELFKFEVAKITGNLGRVANGERAYDQANKHFQKAINEIITLKGTEDTSLVKLYTNLGINYYQVSDYFPAIDYINKATRILIKQHHTENHIDIAYLYRGLSRIYWEMGSSEDIEKSRAYLDKVLAIHKATNNLDHPTMGRVYQSIGTLHETDNNWEGALVAYQKMLEVYKRNYGPEHRNIGKALFDIAAVHGELKNYDKAISTLQESLDISIAEDGEKNIDAAWSHVKIGELNYEIGNYEKAFISIQKSLAATVGHFDWENLDDNPPVDNIILKRALLQFLDKKLSLYRTHYKEQGEDIRFLKRAFSAGSTAVEILDRNKLDYKFDGGKQLLLRQASGLVSRTVDVGLEIAELENNSEHLSKLYQVIEKTRGMLLQEAMTDTKAKLFTNIPETIEQKEKELKDQLGNTKKVLNDFLSKGGEDVRYRDSLDNEIFALSRSLDSIFLHLENNYPEYYQLKYDLSVATTDEVASFLGNEETLIEYVLTEDRLFAFAISKEEVFYHQSKVDSSFFNQLKELRTAISGSHLRMTTREQEVSRKSYIANAYSLYQQLLQPIIEKLGDKKDLIIIPDGLLNYVPFEALLTADAEAPYDTYDNLPYVLNDYSIRYEYSATLLLREQIKKPVKTKLFAGFAPVYSGSGLIASRGSEDSIFHQPQGFVDLGTDIASDLRGDLLPLKNNQPEVKKIAKIIGGESIIGEIATERQFKKEAGKYKILHLAMHGFSNDIKPNFSHLVFSEDFTDTIEDRFLHAYELYNMNLNADLAVLSACETGAGRLQKGEGVMSLSRAFKFAGVPNIVMSLWKADDAKTKDLMIDFYTKLKEGLSNSNALRAAKLATIDRAKDNKEAAHPFYWANFVFIGNGTKIDFSERNNWVWYIGIGGVLALILSVFSFTAKR